MAALLRTGLRPGLSPRRVLRRLRDTECGQALVEFAMVVPLFLLLLFALVDFGRAFYTWLLITNAAREGARAAAVQMDQPSVYDRIYSSFCSHYPSDCSLDPAKVAITGTNIQGPRGEEVTIEVEYDFEFVTPIGNIIRFISGGNIDTPTIRAVSSMRLE